MKEPVMRRGVALVVLGLVAAGCRQKPAEVRVTPAKATIWGIGKKAAFQCEVRDKKGRPMPNVKVTWTVDKAKAASVDAGGIVKSLASGRVLLTASAPGASGTAVIDVIDIASLTVSPSRATLVGPRGTTTVFTAEVRDSKGKPVVQRPQWTTADPNVAVADASGAVRSVTEGRTTVIASLGDISGAADLRVLFAEIAAFEIAPVTLIMQPGETQRISALVRDTAGNTIEDAALVWSSSDPGIATVANGAVTAKARGTSTISVNAGTRTLQASVLVN